MSIRNNDDFVSMFEDRLCEYTDAPFAVAVDRCTNAILLALVALEHNKSTPIAIPRHTYVSVPMTLINYGYNVQLEYREWQERYQIGNTPVHDCAVGFRPFMYTSGQMQCLSFHQKKRLAIGMGGAILLDDPDLYHKLKRLRHDGRDSSVPLQKEMARESFSRDFLVGYHMYMPPDNAAKGILLLNQLSPHYAPGSFQDYPDMAEMPYLKDYMHD